MDVNDYLLDTNGIDWAEELQPWSWCIREPLSVLLANRFGDVFLQRDDGSVLWLDVGWADLRRVADSFEEFTQLLDEPANADEWLKITITDECRSLNMALTTGQCYGYVVPLFLGGKLEPSNIEATDISVHFHVLGQLGEQTNELPAGTAIGRVESPDG